MTDKSENSPKTSDGGTGRFRLPTLSLGDGAITRIGPHWLFVAIVLFVSTLYLGNHRLFATWELAIADVMMRLGHEPPTTQDVVVVTIDDSAVDKLGDWPWNAERIAYLVGMLGEYKPTAIGLDFELPTRHEGDSLGRMFLAEMIASAGNVIAPLRFTLGGAQLGTLPSPPDVGKASFVFVGEDPELLDMPIPHAGVLRAPLSEFAQASWNLGHINSVHDLDGKVRAEPLIVKYGGDYYPSMSLQLVRAYYDVHRTNTRIEPGTGVLVGSTHIPTDEAGRFPIDYRGPSRTMKWISAARVLEGDANPPDITGKLVVVGVTASGYGTQVATPVDGGMPRCERIAQSTANMLSRRFISHVKLSMLFDLLVLAAIGMFCALVLPRITLVNRLAILLVLAFVSIDLNYILYTAFDVLTNTLYPSMELLLFLMVSPLVKMKKSSMDELEEIHQAASGVSTAAGRPAPAGVRAAAASRPAKSESHIDADGVKVRVVGEDRPSEVISGLERTMMVSSAENATGDEAILAKAMSGQLQVGEGTSGVATATPPGLKGTGTVNVVTPPAPATGDGSVTPDTPLPPITPGDSSGLTLTQTLEIAATEKKKRPPIDKLTQDKVQKEYEEKRKQRGESRQVDGVQQLGRYEIVGALGEGAMGTVQKGRDPAIDRLVALKTIKFDDSKGDDAISELRERLLREAMAAGKLSHPNIVTVYDVGSDGGLDYIAMECLEGYTLEDLVKKQVNFNFKIVAKIILQVCSALDYAHAQGIVHRDIKPANIMVLDNFQIKVMDFGIARFDQPSMSMTQTGIAMGTPHYIAPELLKGETVDRRADIFSLGVVIYELLTKRRPFTADNISQLIFAITQKEPIPPSEIDPNVPGVFDAVVKKALAKDPWARYQSAKELAGDLSIFVDAFTGGNPLRM